jgi:hypothetical protein
LFQDYVPEDEDEEKDQQEQQDEAEDKGWVRAENQGSPHLSFTGIIKILCIIFPLNDEYVAPGDSRPLPFIEQKEGVRGNHWFPLF